jgi:hypothetical protein
MSFMEPERAAAEVAWEGDSFDKNVMARIREK